LHLLRCALCSPTCDSVNALWFEVVGGAATSFARGKCQRSAPETAKEYAAVQGLEQATATSILNGKEVLVDVAVLTARGGGRH
jgi:hypothetical protein